MCRFIKIRLRKWKFLKWQGIFFSFILFTKMGVKMNLRCKTKNHAADPEIGFLTKSIERPNVRVTVMPTAWELIANFCQTITFVFSPSANHLFPLWYQIRLLPFLSKYLLLLHLKARQWTAPQTHHNLYKKPYFKFLNRSYL